MIYRATRQFSLGITSSQSVTLKQGETIEVIDEIKISLNGFSYDVPSVKACIKMNWLEEIDNPKPVVEDTKVIEDFDGDVKTDIPADWKELHWMKKLNFVKACTNIELLYKIKHLEQGAKFLFHVDNQIKSLENNPILNPKLVKEEHAKTDTKPTKKPKNKKLETVDFKSDTEMINFFNTDKEDKAEEKIDVIPEDIELKTFTTTSELENYIVEKM